MEDSQIKKEVCQIGKKTFLLTAAMPWFFTIFLLTMLIFYAFEKGISYFTQYGRADELGYIIPIWLVFSLPLTITSMVGKRLLYTKYPKLIFLTPLLVIILTIVFLFLGFEVHVGLINANIVGETGDMWGLEYFIGAPFIAGFWAIVSIIVSVILYKKHISKKVFDPSLT